MSGAAAAACHASAVGNVTLPTPVFLAGGALCLVAGYLVGSVTAPDTPDRTTGQVVSFDSRRSLLCLEGDAIQDQEGVDSDGKLCGTLRRTPNAQLPRKGDAFRFVSVRTSGKVNGKTEQQIVIYGDVVD
jgi:hypothetical protein